MTNSFLIQDLNTSGSSEPENFAVIGSYLYFLAADEAGAYPDTKVWRTDGTPSGVEQVFNEDTSGTVEFLSKSDELVVFAKDNNELHASSIATNSTGLIHLFDGYLSLDVNSFAPTTSDGIFFKAVDSSANSELWITDGTTAGTSEIVDNNGAPIGAVLTNSTSFAVVSDKLYFLAANGTSNSNYNLHLSEGTSQTTSLVFNVDQYVVKNLASAGDKLFFRGKVAGSGDFPSLWVHEPINGTAPMEIGAGIYPYYITAVGDNVFFTAVDNSGDMEVWTSDGTVGNTRRVKDITVGGPTEIRDGLFVSAGGKAFFEVVLRGPGVGGPGPIIGSELWISDGLDSGTQKLADFNHGGENIIKDICECSDKTFFQVLTKNETDEVIASELWVSDGTSSGTFKLKEFNDALTHLTEVGTSLYFIGSTDSHGSELWVSDGTSGGTSMVDDLNPGSASGVDAPIAGGQTYLAVIGDTIFFRADDGSGMGVELWGYQHVEKSSNSNQESGSNTDNSSNSGLGSGTEDVLLKVHARNKVVDLNASLAFVSDSLSSSILSGLIDSGINIGTKLLSYEHTLKNEAKDLTLAFGIDKLIANPGLTNSQGKRDMDKKIIHYKVDQNGNLTPAFNPKTGHGSRHFDVNGDGIADTIVHLHSDGKTGDGDGKSNGVIESSSTIATVALKPSFSKTDNGCITCADPDDATTPACWDLQALLGKRSSTVHSIGYVIFDADEIAISDDILSDFDQVQSRAVNLFSSLQDADVVLHEAFSFKRCLQILNGQHVQFFSVDGAQLSDLSSLSDSRFSFLEQTVTDDGSISITSADNTIDLVLSQMTSDPNLDALIGSQQQYGSPILDFTAFAGDEIPTITGKLQLAREADYDAILGFYRVANREGSVISDDGSILTPGDTGYTQAALRESNRVTPIDNLTLEDNTTADVDFSLTEFSYLAPYAKVNGNTFFAFDAANADGLSHFRSLGQNLIGLEDMLGGGDLDYDDFIIAFNSNPIII